MRVDSAGRIDMPEAFIIGRKYHCSWAKSRGMVWILISIENNIATLETPRTHKRITTDISYLRDINKNCKFEI